MAEDLDDEKYCCNYDTLGRPIKSGFWTEDRVQYLVAGYRDGLPVRHIAQKLNCGIGAVTGKADRLSLVHKYPPMIRRGKSGRP
jgi:hypothetical protein